ncbi:hypothetical protein INR49_002801 [Caranx melampygus]|nr:hypothetical protein INR49_002801 [Caranx melampygus]
MSQRHREDKEVVDPNFMHGSTRISTISRGSRTKKSEESTAYTSNPVTERSFKVRNLDSDSDSVAETCATSASEMDAETNADDTSDRSQKDSGSADSFRYTRSQRKKDHHHLMSMRKTLALIHLALVWSREPLTLSDLLRLVNEGHVPYVNAYEELPEEMMLKGSDGLVFKVESVPSHRLVHKEAEALIPFLQLPAFPPIERQSLLHPALLSVRYLTDANLPDELHPWVCRVMARADMVHHSYHPLFCRFLPQYELQAAALIIVTMKFIFGLDDHTEW